MLSSMKRMFVIPFVSALVGGGVVVAVIAAAGGLGESTKTVVTTVESAAPAAPSNASQRSERADAARSLRARRARRGVRDLDGRAEVRILAVQPVRRRDPAPGHGDRLGHRDRRQRHDPDQLPRGRERRSRSPSASKKASRSKRRSSARTRPDDLAILRIPTDGLTLHPLKLGDSSAVQVGDPVYAIGNPFDLERTLTTGVISALQRRDHRAQRLHDQQRAADRRADQPRQLRRPAAQRRGRSDRHQLADRDRRQRRRQRRHRLLDPDQHRQVGDRPAREGRHRPRRLPRPHLADDRRLALGAEPAGQGGALVQSVQPGTAARKAGIRGGTVDTTTEDGQVAVGGDIIVAIDGKPSTSSEELAERHRGEEAGRHGQRSNCGARWATATTNTRRSP